MFANTQRALAALAALVMSATFMAVAIIPASPTLMV